MTEKRHQWASNLGFILAAAGSAVGLGNIWKFPGKVGAYGGGAFLLFRYKDNFRIEYEYSFTNGEMDFAMVLGNARRKQLLSLRIREMEAGGWADGPTFEKYDSMKDVKRLDYFLNSKSRLYYLYFVRDGKRTLLLMEPSQEMVNMMAQYSKVLES